MRKHLFILFAYLLLPCLTAVAQTRENTAAGRKLYAAFKKETKNLKNDTNKVLRYLEFAKVLESYSVDTVVALNKIARDLSEKLHYQRGIELSVFEEGIHAESNTDYQLAIHYYREAARMAEMNRFYNDIYAIYNTSLNAYYYLADYPNAMDIAQKGILLADRLNDRENLAHYYNQAGFIYQKQQKPTESIKYSANTWRWPMS